MSKESHPYYYNGREGVFIDEECVGGDCVHLNCCVCDEEGDIVFNCEFPLNTRPEEISEFLLVSADKLLQDCSDGINLESAYEKAETIRKHARRLKF